MEDDDTVAALVAEWIKDAAPGSEVAIAASRASAVAILEDDAMEFDLIVCDLLIPPTDDSVDTREEYGLEVHEVARHRHPGTLCLFFTGHADEVDTNDELSRGGVADVFGSGDIRPLVQLIKKLDMDRAVEYVQVIAREIEELNEIVVESPAGPAFGHFEDRVIRIFTRRHGGRRIRIDPLGGLSGAKTFRAEVRGDTGLVTANVFGKVTSLEDVKDEEGRFAGFVPISLDPARTPTPAGVVVSGAGRTAGIFYALAARFGRSLFDVLRHDDATALGALAELRDVFRPWEDQPLGQTTTIGDLRRTRCADSVFEQFADGLGNLDYAALEATPVDLQYAPQHGDLHGENVLVDDEGHIMLIDFGDVARQPMGFDPIVLELSVLFHQERPTANPDWPSAELAAHWLDDSYLESCPWGAFIAGCRQWAADVSGAPFVVPVLTYVDALRQLKYPDTRKDVALAIARSAGSAATALLG